MKRRPHLIRQLTGQHRLPILNHIGQLPHRITDRHHTLHTHPPARLNLHIGSVPTRPLIHLTSLARRPVQSHLLSDIPRPLVSSLSRPHVHPPGNLLSLQRPPQIIARPRRQRARLKPSLHTTPRAKLPPLPGPLTLQLSRPLHTLPNVRSKRAHLHTLSCANSSHQHTFPYRAAGFPNPLPMGHNPQTPATHVTTPSTAYRSTAPHTTPAPSPLNTVKHTTCHKTHLHFPLSPSSLHTPIRQALPHPPFLTHTFPSIIAPGRSSPEDKPHTGDKRCLIPGI